MTKVVFPCDQETWWIIKDQLHYLKNLSEQDNCDLTKLAECHQRIYNTNLGHMEQPDINWGSSVFYGLVKYLRKHTSTEERGHFLKETFPAIIDLGLMIETLLPTEGIVISEQQKDCSYSIPRQLCVSVLALAFLCLFPNEQRGRGTKLNNINFNKFFSNLPIPSQNAKLRCILNFFDRVSSEFNRLKGSVVFTRQVLKLDEIPSLDTWLDCTSELCPVTVHTAGVIEDAGSDTIEVDFANRYIGGGILGRGRVQEEIRFTVCPELIVSMLFMEVMDDNEAIVIKGFEQFSATIGYASGLQFAGDYKDNLQVDSDGNLKKMLCAIDAVSYSHGRGGEQYTDHFILRDLNKAFTGFCVKFPYAGAQSSSEEDYYTADETETSQDTGGVYFSILNYADNLVSNAVEMALFEVVLKLTKRRKFNHSSSSDTQDSSFSKSSVSAASAGSTDNEIPMDHLEVNFRDWLAHYRRRSSNLSDLSSRRSSYDSRRGSYDLPSSRRSSGCSTRNSSEFGSELEEYYENYQQQEKYKYHTIQEEEVGPSIVNEFAMNLAESLLREGTEAFAATAKAESGVKQFYDIQPSTVKAKPSPVKARKVKVKSDDLIVKEFDSRENSKIDGNENIIRMYVDNFFSEIWPFQTSEEPEDWTESQIELRSVLSQLKIINVDTDLEEISDNDEEGDSICSDSDLSIDDDQDDSGEDADDDNLLINVANNLVVKAFTEALMEYKQRYRTVGSRNYGRSRVSSTSSLGDSDYGALETCDLNVNTSASAADNAASAADKVMLDIFESIPDTGALSRPGIRPDLGARPDLGVRQDLGARPKVPQIHTSIIPLQASCDSDVIGDTIGDTDTRVKGDNVSGMNTEPNSNKIEIIPIEISYDAISRFSEENKDINRGNLGSIEMITQADAIAHVELDSGISSPAVAIPIHSQGICDIEFTEHNKENSSPRRHSIKSNLSKSPNASNSLSERSMNICSSPKRDSINFSPVHLWSNNSSPRSAKSESRKLKRSGSKSTNSSHGKSRKNSHMKDTGSKRFSPSVDSSNDPKEFNQFANSLSRDLLTNVFLQVQDTGAEDLYSFPRRSSEPMQISNGAALQRLQHSIHTVNGKITQKSKTDEDIGKFAEELSRHGATCDVGNRKSGSGFRDPILSRFAEELMKANVSVPTFQLLNGCVSTSESSRSICSTVSSFRDPLLAGFEDELLNSSFGKSSARTQSSWSNRRGQLCHPHVRHVSGNEGSENNIQFPSRYLGASFDSEFSAMSWMSVKTESVPSGHEVSEFADRLSRRIVLEAVSTAFRDNFPPNLNVSNNARMRKTRTSKCKNLNDYSNKLATSILRTAMSEAENRMVCSDWLEQNKMVTWGEETECLEYSNEETETSDSEAVSSENHGSLRDRKTDGSMSSLEYEDALDLPYQRLEAFAESVASCVLTTSVAVLRREEESQMRRQYGRPIATGNWGCGAFGGNPHLKSLIQWMAASYAGTPHLIYYTFDHVKMDKFEEVVDVVLTRGWTVSELMQAVRQFCVTARAQLQQSGELTVDLFEYILHGNLQPQ